MRQPSCRAFRQVGMGGGGGDATAVLSCLQASKGGGALL